MCRLDMAIALGRPPKAQIAIEPLLGGERHWREDQRIRPASRNKVRTA